MPKRRNQRARRQVGPVVPVSSVERFGMFLDDFGMFWRIFQITLSSFGFCDFSSKSHRGWKMYEYGSMQHLGLRFHHFIVIIFFGDCPFPTDMGPQQFICSFFSLHRWFLRLLHVQLRHLLQGKEKKDREDAKEKEPKSKETGQTSGASVFR